jgi:glutamate-1-semialdehyde 2,1-aminomutase
MNVIVVLLLAGLAITVLARLWRWWSFLRAKGWSLAGHPRLAGRLARLLPGYSLDETEFFSADAAGPPVTACRREGFMRLAAGFRERFPRGARLTQETAEALSDLQLTRNYRVPFPFRDMVKKHLPSAIFLKASAGVRVTDLDGNDFYDLAGSYGVNLFGYDFYKSCIDRGVDMVRELGPVLGSYHPVVAENVQALRAISGLDEVSFHMSGTEAVMQAVRLARYHNRRRCIVRFCGAYHGWWGDVQPGVGNPVTPRDTLTLRELEPATLRALERGGRDIACVLVNPLQALHPNRGAEGDQSLVDSSRSAGFDKAAYTDWLQQLRQVCTRRGIALIFDEVFMGFRLAPGGAQEYFGVKADLVTYGKTLGGGLPIGVLCGRPALMRRFRDDRPADVCFARGTFNSHPYVMGAMHEFLRRLATPEVRALYDGLDHCWDGRAVELNKRLADAGVPVAVANMTSVWTTLYRLPSRYNWMLQYYLRSHGLALSWVGTGRLIFSLNYSDADFAAVADRFVAAARQMESDGWWWHNEGLTNKAIRRRVFQEMIAHRT